ncbi:MAG: class I SAM-dependent methyltransferase [Chloroflexi bacterium]|nr:class I SAM-dependent methyltransferase [Chloroflexota bacterium]
MTTSPAGFACLWCGQSHTPRRPDDLEVYARLCPTCLGRAGENEFLRFRLKQALAERATGVQAPVPAGPRVPVPTRRPAVEDEMRAYYAARAPEYDDFYLRRGRYEHGPVHDVAWQTELDQVTRWLDDLPLRGEILELAAGTGWWSPLLAQKGHLTITDASREPLAIAAQRLAAHRLRAGVVIRDAWEPPDRAVDGLFAGFWLSHVPRPRLGEFLALAHAWLAPGGRFAFIDSLEDSHSGAVPAARRNVAPGLQERSLADGRRFRVVKEYYRPDELDAALREAGFGSVDVRGTARFFVLGSAVAAARPLSSPP